MCIVCSADGAQFGQSIAALYRGLGRPRSRFLAEEIVPDATQPLDPHDHEDLAGPADVILRGGPILTMRRPGEAVEALAVRGGRIQALGAGEEVMSLRGRLTRVIDLDGRAVMPGFINTHWHPPLSVLCDWLDWDAAEARREIAAALGEVSNEWLIVSCSANGDQKAAACSAADAIAHRPCVIVDRSGEVVHSNKPAITRYEARSEPLPIASAASLLPLFMENLTDSRDSLRIRLQRTFADLARGGFTMVRFCGLGGITGYDDVALVRSAIDGQALLRVRGTLDMRLPADAFRLPDLGDDIFRLDAFTTWIDDGEWPNTDLVARIAELRRLGWRAILHARGVNGVRAAIATACDGLECRIGDAREVAAALTQTPITLGLTAAETAELHPADAFSALAASGIACTLSLDRIAGVATALETVVATGGRWDFVTTAGARRCGVESIVGTLDIGRYADLAFLDGDPRKVAATHLRCLSTWVQGREVRPTARVLPRTYN